MIVSKSLRTAILTGPSELLWFPLLDPLGIFWEALPEQSIASSIGQEPEQMDQQREAWLGHHIARFGRLGCERVDYRLSDVVRRKSALPCARHGLIDVGQKRTIESLHLWCAVFEW